jgi:hypothetical protein
LGGASGLDRVAILQNVNAQSMLAAFSYAGLASPDLRPNAATSADDNCLTVLVATSAASAFPLAK